MAHVLRIDKAIYTTPRWRRERTAFLAVNPLCIDHKNRGLVVEAVIVDHRIPHRGDEILFWDKTNWQPLCKRCHDSHKQRLEKSGRVAGCDIEGLPLDPSHHWHDAK